MAELPKTHFSQWTNFGYGSFYKRYVDGLRDLAQKRFRCSAEAADSLAHAFVAEQSCAHSGGLLDSFDRQRRFRSYVVVSFLNHCRRSLGGAEHEPLDEDLPAAPADDPAANLLAQEAEELRREVRGALEEARASLLERGVLGREERAYLELKWPAESERAPLTDLQVGERLRRRGLLSAKTPGALARASARLGALVGRQLIARLCALLEDSLLEHHPELSADELAPRTQLSLGAIVHVLALEERLSEQRAQEEVAGDRSPPGDTATS